MLLPLVVTELSRPRDAAWGAVFLIWALVLITNNDRMGGAPMLAVLSSSLLIGRLGVEVAQNRWNQLSGDERVKLATLGRWTNSFSELNMILRKLGGNLINHSGARRTKAKVKKKWVRAEGNIVDEESRDSAE